MGRIIPNLSLLDFDSTLASADKLVVVEFYLSSCPHCRAVAPIYEAVAEQMGDEALFFKVDAADQRTLTARFGVAGTPHLQVLLQ